MKRYELNINGKFKNGSLLETKISDLFVGAFETLEEVEKAITDEVEEITSYYKDVDYLGFDVIEDKGDYLKEVMVGFKTYYEF